MKQVKAIENYGFTYIFIYLFNFLSALGFYLAYKDKSKKIAFHSLQALIFYIGGDIVSGIFGTVSYIAFIIMFFLVWIYGIYIGIKAYRGHDLKIPIVGNLAERFTGYKQVATAQRVSEPTSFEVQLSSGTSQETKDKIVELIQRGEINEALNALNNEIAKNPRYPENYAVKAMLLHEAFKNDKDSLNTINIALAIDPQRPVFHKIKGDILTSLGNNEEAVQEYDKAIGLQPDFAEAYSRKALALLNLGNIDEATQVADKGVLLDPNSSFTHRSRGLVIGYGDKNYDEALKEINEALKIEPDNGINWALLAIFKSYKGKTDEAINDLKTAIAKNPSLKHDICYNISVWPDDQIANEKSLITKEVCGK